MHQRFSQCTKFSTSLNQMRCLVEVKCLIAIADRRIRSRMDFNEQSIGTCGNRRQSDINNMTPQAHAM